jgi:acyl-CoA hydrolase
MPVVTACSERVEFRAPVKQGERIELVGRVTDQGRSSLRVTIEMHREDLLTGDRSLCTTGEFVMVAVDSDGRPASIESRGARPESRALARWRWRPGGFVLLQSGARPLDGFETLLPNKIGRLPE